MPLEEGERCTKCDSCVDERSCMPKAWKTVGKAGESRVTRARLGERSSSEEASPKTEMPSQHSKGSGEGGDAFEGSGDGGVAPKMSDMPISSLSCGLACKRATGTSSVLSSSSVLEGEEGRGLVDGLSPHALFPNLVTT